MIGELIDDRYKIIDRLGSGAMGVVYRAERVGLKRHVAVKFLDEKWGGKDGVARFEREARAISRLQHRHVVSMVDFGVHQKRPYIVMEYLAGKLLSAEMGRPTMTPARAVALMRQILDALKHAHKNGVIHRDLKPDNVMLTEVTGEHDFVKILDFGLARIVSVDEPSISLPQQVAGTPSYMSPEQVRGEKIDHRTDLYAAGVMLYAMCVGKKPFRGEGDVDVLKQHLFVAPAPPRKAAPRANISPSLERAILRALAKPRDERFYHAQEFLDALEATPEAQALGARRRSRFASAFSALLLIGLGAGGALFANARMSGRAVRSTAPPIVAASPPPVAKPAVAPAPPPAPKPEPNPDTPTGTKTGTGTGTTTTDPIQQRALALIAANQLRDAEKLLLPQVGRHPNAAWIHLELGEIYFRRIWRPDAVRQWDLALARDPSLAHDPTLASHFCAALGRSWGGTVERLMVRRLAADAVEAMQACIRDTDDLWRLQAAVRVLERVGKSGDIDRALVQARSAELRPKR